MEYTSEIMVTRSDGAVQRERITFTERNKRGEEIIIDLSRCDLFGTIGKAWKSAGHIDKNMSDWIGVEVFATDKHNYCRGKYNPTMKKDEDLAAGFRINFDWVLPWTEENREKIINEIYRRAEF